MGRTALMRPALLTLVCAACSVPGADGFEPSNPIGEVVVGSAGGMEAAGGGSVAGAGGGTVSGSGGGTVSGTGGGSVSGTGGGSVSGTGGGSTSGTGGGSGGSGGSSGAGGGTVQGVELNPGWIGGACSSAQSCNAPGYTSTASCETSGFQNGFCTQACTVSGSTYVCPDAPMIGGTSGNTVSRCVSANGLPRCVAECDFVQSPGTGCRPGYACVMRQRYNQPDRIFKVCMPMPQQRWPGEAAPANDIGAACTTQQSCANNVCMSMASGYCTKSFCDTTGCPSGSTCFGVGMGQTACLKDCTSDSQCRQSDGYVCHPQHRVCLPGASMGGTWNPSVGASDCMVAWGTAGSGLSVCDTVKDDYVVVRKSARNLALCRNGMLVQNYRMGLGFAPIGDKNQEGDGKTPEGVFYAASLNPNSSYYKSFLVSYPDSSDATRGLSTGLITQAEKNAIDSAQASCGIPPQTTNLGSYIMVHGYGSSSDWTLGCVAVENSVIDVLWATIGVRDTIVILP